MPIYNVSLKICCWYFSNYDLVGICCTILGLGQNALHLQYKGEGPCYFCMETEMITCTSGMDYRRRLSQELSLIMRTKEVLLQVFYYPTMERLKWVTNKANEMDQVFKSVGGV